MSQVIKIQRSKWKQLTFTGTLYSLIPGQAPKLNRIERFNQKPLVQKILRKLS